MAVKLDKVAGRAATGAAIGTAIPGVGTAVGGAAGGLYGLLEGLFSGDDSSGPSAADAAAQAAAAEKLRRMEEAARTLGAQRTQSKQEGMNVLANRMGAYQGANNVLASMYGPRGSMAPNINLASGGPRMAGSPELAKLGQAFAPPGPRSTQGGMTFGASAPQPQGATDFTRRPSDRIFAPPAPQAATSPVTAGSAIGPGVTQFTPPPRPALAAPTPATTGMPGQSAGALQALSRLFTRPGALTSAPGASATGAIGGVGSFR